MREEWWNVQQNYDIDEVTGLARQKSGSLCTLHFFHAFPGERLTLTDDSYVYRVAQYGMNRPEKYLYTYDYQEEENWSTYTGNLTGQEFRENDWVFEEEVYFRIILKPKGERKRLPDLRKILCWKQKPECGNRPTYEDEIKKTVQTIQNIQQDNEDSFHFLLLTDTHYTVNGIWEDTRYHLRRVSQELRQGENIDLQGIIHLGDLTDGCVPKKITSDYVRVLQDDLKGLGLPFYYVLGNHDWNYFRNNPQCFTEEEVRKLYLPRKTANYYFQDDREHRLRMIFLESFQPKEKIRYGFSEEELDWLEEILEETPEDYCVLVFSHVPPLDRLHYWSKEIRGSRRLICILKRFHSYSGGRLLGFIHGHNHADQIDREEGFPIISIGCSKYEYFTDKKPEGAITYERSPETAKQELWDILTVNIGKRTLDFTRFGAGEDRHVEGNCLTDQQGEQRPMKKVITYGTFDLFHEGHYNLLKRAKKLGDYLIVGVTTEHFDEQRGKFNIVDPLLTRIENVRATGFADEIIIEDHDGQKVEDILKYDVDIFTLGSDWRGSFDYLKDYCKVVYLERTPGVSSTMLRNAKYPIVRMGIVGSGRIAPRFLKEARYVSGLEAECVYNPHRQSAEAFARDYSLVAHSGEFSEFLNAVDAIYIATPHETHYGYAKAAIEAGKHVLCEKPLTFSKKQAEELFAIAREKKLVMMEGIKTAYCPGFQQIVEVAKSGKIGELMDVEACFSRLTPSWLREMTDEAYGGAFMEFGSYTLLPIFKLLGTDYEEMRFDSIPAPNGVDLYTKIHFRYRKGLATSKTGLGVKSEGQLLISGTKGYILAESPWWLTRKFQVRYEDPNQIENYTPKFIGDGLRYEISDFLSRIHGLKGAACQLLEEESVAMIGVVEKFLNDRQNARQKLRKENVSAGVKLWAHRGCSYRYPENTLAAFQAACELKGLQGIELDIQLSKDGEIVVFHDETLDRLMDQTGQLQDYTVDELKGMHFKDWEGAGMEIPKLEEVLQLLQPYLQKKQLLLNIELKNGRVAYPGMEEKVLKLVKKYDVLPYIVFSSFNGESILQIRELEPQGRVAILQKDMTDAIRFAQEHALTAIHPYVGSVLETRNTEVDKELCIRAWNSEEPFYRQKRQRTVYHLRELKEKGITDFITNMPEDYLDA